MSSLHQESSNWRCPRSMEAVVLQPRMALTETTSRFPLRIGYDCAGVVTEVGNAVNSIKVGDEVWSRLPEVAKGSLGEYIKCPSEHISVKPTNLSFAEAASLPLAALTSMQALGKYQGSLVGKTVFVPAGRKCSIVFTWAKS